MSACKHCNRCKDGCKDVCMCCGVCNTCGMQTKPAVAAPAPVFIPYAVPNPMPIPTITPYPVWAKPADWYQRVDITCAANPMPTGDFSAVATLSPEASINNILFAREIGVTS